MEGAMVSNTSEEIRLRYLYRNLILRGKVRVSIESARKLIGPDCAFHLYGRMYPGRKTYAKSRRLAG
jgi:hypothetical protein